METINKGGYMAEFYTDINKEVFEEKIRGMFDSIWGCEIDHPVFQDTVGELMGAVIALWDNCHSTVSPSTQSKIIRCNDCKHYKYGICKKAGLCVNKSPNGFCDWGEKREEGET